MKIDRKSSQSFGLEVLSIKIEYTVSIFIYIFIYPPLLKSTHTTYRIKCKQATYCTKY